jgi:hypothetical protein
MFRNTRCGKYLGILKRRLELENTDFFVPQTKSCKLSNLYRYKKGKMIVEDKRGSSIYYSLPEAISGGGGWWSSYGGLVTSINNYYILTKQ